MFGRATEASMSLNSPNGEPQNKSEPIKTVEIFCDGACSGNPGPGGWAAILRYNGKEKVISGNEAQTTNNRMELTACLEALRCLKEACRLIIKTDSQYLAKAFNEGWLEKWRCNGWRTSGRKPVKNRDLWEQLLKLIARHQITWHWIKGHSGHPENERCDKLAVLERDRAAIGANSESSKTSQTRKEELLDSPETDISIKSSQTC